MKNKLGIGEQQKKRNEFKLESQRNKLKNEVKYAGEAIVNGTVMMLATTAAPMLLPFVPPIGTAYSSGKAYEFIGESEKTKKSSINPRETSKDVLALRKKMLKSKTKETGLNI